MLTKNIKMEEQKELTIKTRFWIGEKGKYLGITITTMTCKLFQNIIWNEIKQDLLM